MMGQLVRGLLLTVAVMWIITGLAGLRSFEWPPRGSGNGAARNQTLANGLVFWSTGLALGSHQRSPCATPRPHSAVRPHRACGMVLAVALYQVRRRPSVYGIGLALFTLAFLVNLLAGSIVTLIIITAVTGAVLVYGTVDSIGRRLRARNRKSATR